jgi:hypothetical protein
MNDKHPRHSESVPHPDTSTQHLSEAERKKLELGDAMEHEHGQAREETEEDIEKIDDGGQGKSSR